MHFIYGNEPYSVDIVKKKYLDSDKFNIRITYELSDEDKYFLQSKTFFEDKERLLMFVVDEPKKLRTIDESWNYDNLVAIFYGKTGECFSLAEKDYVRAVCCDKYSDEQIFNLVSHSISADSEVVNYFIKSIDYRSEEVCLYSVISELNKLKVFKNITKDLIDDTLNVVTAESNVFALGAMICAGKRHEVVESIKLYSPKKEMAYIGALQKYFRVGWKKNYFSSKTIGYGDIVEPKFAIKAMKYLEQANIDIISGEKIPSIALMNAVVMILDEAEVSNA